jgi:phosphate transport system substrate-binding protein
MRKRAVFAAIAACALAATIAAGATARSQRSSDVTITGAGSTFVQPLVQAWTAAVGQAFGFNVQYSGVGSGAGITAVTNRTVDFGASDAPLTPDQFAACKGCVQIPWALSATSVIYNLGGVKNNLHMNGKVLAQIFMGQVTKWNDPAIQKLNKGVNLPGTDIAVAHRSDNSGTTYNFTDYLSSVSGDWKSKFGVGVAVNWPTGSGGRGSAGLAAIVAQTEGAIGYVDVAYALKNHLKFMSMQNRSGKYATPGLRGIAAAAASDIKPTSTGELSIVNPPKKFPLAYPISTYTYAIVPTQTSKAADIKKFLFWAVTKGQEKQYTARLLFQPLPRYVLAYDNRAIKKISNT